MKPPADRPDGDVRAGNGSREEMPMSPVQRESW
jgi:hypothetical protein